MNVGGWLLLTALFGILLLVIQRAERARRIATFVILLIAAALVSGYGVYRMGNECPVLYFGKLCVIPQYHDRALATAYTTTNLAALTAIALNLLFWLFIGRYNPPGSSDDIRVLGLND